MSWKVLPFIISITCVIAEYETKKPPNIVVIMSDDHGHNDVSFKGSDEIPTPNIDALAYSGVTLNRFYTPATCSPSRSSLMTGKYPHRLGMQNVVIPSYEPWGLSPKEKILPQYLKEVGYSTTLIGKWHLGFYQKQYWPTNRGFDVHKGFLGVYIDYNNYTYKDLNISRGYDMRHNLESVYFPENKYATDLFTDDAVDTIMNHDQSKPMFLMVNHAAPHCGNDDAQLQAPEDEIAKFSYIENLNRRTLAAMISILDRGVGAVIKALKDSNMIDNTIVVFLSDNGGLTFGVHNTTASNFPLKGQKATAWEGAIRNNAIVYAPFLENHGVVRNQFIHITDLFVMLAKRAGVHLDPYQQRDGKDPWRIINRGGSPIRHEIQTIVNNGVFDYGSLISGRYKFVNGSNAKGLYDKCLSPDNRNVEVNPNYAQLVLSSITAQVLSSVDQQYELTAGKILNMRNKLKVNCEQRAVNVPCDLTVAPCLFDIIDDPCEENNLADSNPTMTAALKARFDSIESNIVPSRRRTVDYACDPSHFNFTWSDWQPNSNS